MDVTISVVFIYGQINNLIRYASARIRNNMRPNELLVRFDAALAVVFLSHFDCVAAYMRTRLQQTVQAFPRWYNS